VKRYQFRLGQVLKVRRIELDRAEAEVVRARADVAAATRRITEREDTYRTLSRRPRGDTMTDLTTVREQQRLVADAILAARAAEQVAQQELAVRLAEWTEADKKVRLLEQLDERHRAHHTGLMLAEEQQVLDDLVTSRQGRGR
jgi:flagellar export protein FliJ